MRRLGLAIAGLLALAPAASASPTQESTFQDDDRLLAAPSAEVARTLDTLRGLGVDRVRVRLTWRAVAPSPDRDARPGFDAADHTAYPAGAWDRYDTLLRLATERGLAINLDVAGPAPDWATGTPERPDIDETYEPSAMEFGQFVRAAGARYPAVDTWALWNEPNHPGWLTPQWTRDGRAWVESSPRQYRALVDAGWQALQETGHARHTILVGETAPKGTQQRGLTRALTPARFLRALYCLDDTLQFLRGGGAQRRGCPAQPDPGAFVAAHPGLFGAGGYAHHPYETAFAPTTPPRDPEHFTIANLTRLSALLGRIRARYGVPRAVPLHLTEFGYQTAPPDRLGVSFARQAAYLAQAEYLAYRDRQVRTLSQFLLVDDGDPVDRTFQSGLMLADGTAKPAFDAYTMPVVLPRTTVARGARLRVWGFVRAAANGTHPRVDVLVGGHRRATVTASARGYLNVRVRVRRSGILQLRWNAITSRAVRFTVTG
jgi:hypothetical protein